MRTLALLALTAAAVAVPSIAQAQPRAGHSWGQPGQRVVVRQSGPGMRQPGMRGDFRHRGRIGRGQFVPPFWFGPQFEVRQWQVYGFPQPMPGHRWIRYYDDALLVDGRGRVHDGRYGMDWDRYGDRWGRDERGIPVYVGDGDFRPDEEDYAWAEEADDHRGEGWDYSEYGDEGPQRGDCGARGPRGPGPCGRPAHGARGPAYGYSGYGEAGYGYGGYGQVGYTYVCCVTITETIVETGGSSQMVEEVIEERVVRRERVRRRPPPRRPIRGERG